ncbi:MAG: hypothetical protein ACI9TV_000665 [Sulfurimonas sp.]|jgi:membrane protein implicated in regulation of membrane protease activity|uniref:NfeD family protein n=1 Tax=Sulfurimonas sp. TaxID=2022749 RepID=UPI0039E317F6
MENLTLSLISPAYLSAIGIILITLEMLTFSFVLFWFGIGFLLVAGLSLFNVFPDALWQLGSIGLIAMLMLFFLRSRALEVFLKSKKENNDNFLNEAGVGVIKHGKVDYKATYWEISYEGKETFAEDEKVTVLKTEKGVAFIEKIK